MHCFSVRIRSACSQTAHRKTSVHMQDPKNLKSNSLAMKLHGYGDSECGYEGRRLIAEGLFEKSYGLTVRFRITGGSMERYARLRWHDGTLE